MYRHHTRGTATLLVPGEVPAERLGVPRLLLVVELLPDRAGELVDELAGVDEVELRARARGRAGPPERISLRSDSIWRGALGRCTLTTTSSPFGSVARCTWPIEAAAIGISSNSRNARCDR